MWSWSSLWYATARHSLDWSAENKQEVIQSRFVEHFLACHWRSTPFVSPQSSWYSIKIVRETIFGLHGNYLSWGAVSSLKAPVLPSKPCHLSRWARPTWQQVRLVEPCTLCSRLSRLTSWRTWIKKDSLQRKTSSSAESWISPFTPPSRWRAPLDILWLLCLPQRDICGWTSQE